jgi:alpha-methylacyl-CoA racemase
VSVDLKMPEGIALALDLVARADAILEGFRPGAMERLGLGPESVCRVIPASSTDA